jgi:hypothetical protein
MTVRLLVLCAGRTLHTRKITGTFLLDAESTQGYSAAGRIGQSAEESLMVRVPVSAQ